MIDNALVKVIDFWQNAARETGLFPRDLAAKIDIASKEIVDIVGPRRSGKSTSLFSSYQ